MITYREATNFDLPAIRVLGREINALHHAAWPDVFAPSGDPQPDEDFWREMIGVPDATTFVAATDEGVIGFVNIAFVAKDGNPLLQPVSYARVGSVGVAESHRGRGIGTELMRRAEAWAAAKGATRVNLIVWGFNERAVRLYEELGYGFDPTRWASALSPQGLTAYNRCKPVDEARSRPGPAHCEHAAAVCRQREAGLGAGLLPMPFDGCVVDVR